MRRVAVDFGVPLVTNPELAALYLESIVKVRDFCIESNDEVLAHSVEPPTIPNPLSLWQIHDGAATAGHSLLSCCERLTDASAVCCVMKLTPA